MLLRYLTIKAKYDFKNIISCIFFGLFVIALFRLSLVDHAMRDGWKIFSPLAYATSLLAILLMSQDLLRAESASGFWLRMRFKYESMMFVAFAFYIYHLLLHGIIAISIFTFLGILFYVEIDKLLQIYLVLIVSLPTIAALNMLVQSCIAMANKSSIAVFLLLIPFYMPIVMLSIYYLKEMDYNYLIGLAGFACFTIPISMLCSGKIIEYIADD